MSLDDELRSAFTREAQSRVAPPPDPEGLVRGGRARRRRRTLQRAGAGAAAAVLIGAGGYGVSAWGPAPGPGVASRPSVATTGPTTPASEQVRPRLEPGTYRRFVGYAATGPRIEASFTVDGDTWIGGDFPLAGERHGSVFAGIGVYQPRALAAGDGCRDQPTTATVGSSPRRLAAQLAQLPRSTVLEAPAATRAFGRDGFHLRLRIAVECPGYYRVAESPAGERGITYSNPGGVVEDVVIDFWVLDVAGALVVVDRWHGESASGALQAQVERAWESITIGTDA